MTFVGLPFSVLVAIGSAAALATVGLYVLKLRRRQVAVPFSPIWQRVLRDKEASQLFSRLRNLLSLLLQLVLLLAIVLALGDPRAAAGVREGRSLVVLVDTSASMQSTDVAPSRLDSAKAKVAELVQGLGTADRMLVAKMDARTVPVTTMTSDQTELADGVRRLEPTETRADLARGVALALDALRGARNPEIVVVSDGGVDAEAAARATPNHAVPIRYVPVGNRGKNVAITGFSVRRYPLDASRYEVMLEVTNTNDAPENVELSLIGDGKVIDVSRLTLGAKEALPRFYGDLGGASRTLEARIRLASGQHDDLPADDRAFALMPERTRARVLVVTKGNTYLDAALLLDEYLDVTTISERSYPPEGTFDVTIFDGVAPGAPKKGGALYLNPPAEGAPVKLGRELKDFGFDTWDRKSSLLRWMALENVQVARGHALAAEKDDHVVGASEAGPVLVTGAREGLPFVELGFDPRESDLVLRVAWPLFVLNVIHSFVEDDTSYLGSLQTGDVWRIPAPPDVTVAWIKDPRGALHEVAVKEGRAVVFGERAGIYELHSGSPDAPPTFFAGNLSDPAESRIEPVKELSFGGERAKPVEGFQVGLRRETWIYLILFAASLSALEWFLYHRRITV
jgi:hypothetical protein